MEGRPDDLALSPKIESTEVIPFDGYDEWYVFDEKRTFEDHKVFVNWGGFSLCHPSFEDLMQGFWKQIRALNPTTYLAEGDNLVCVTRNRELYKSVLEPYRDSIVAVDHERRE